MFNITWKSMLLPFVVAGALVVVLIGVAVVILARGQVEEIQNLLGEEVALSSSDLPATPVYPTPPTDNGSSGTLTTSSSVPRLLSPAHSMRIADPGSVPTV